MRQRSRRSAFLAARPFKFLCFALRKRCVWEKRIRKCRAVYPFCVTKRHLATHTIPPRHSDEIHDTARTGLTAFHHDRFTNSVISSEAS